MVPEPLQVVIVVQEVEVEVMTVLEEPLAAKDVERTTVLAQDGTGLPLEHDAEEDEEPDDSELVVPDVCWLFGLEVGLLLGPLLPPPPPLPQSITQGRLVPPPPPPLLPPQPKRQKVFVPPPPPPGEGASTGGGPGGPGSGHPGGEVGTAHIAPLAEIELVVVSDESDSTIEVA